jgi:hypothetical protein
MTIILYLFHTHQYTLCTFSDLYNNAFITYYYIVFKNNIFICIFSKRSFLIYTCIYKGSSLALELLSMHYSLTLRILNCIYFKRGFDIAVNFFNERQSWPWRYRCTVQCRCCSETLNVFVLYIKSFLVWSRNHNRMTILRVYYVTD